MYFMALVKEQMCTIAAHLFGCKHDKHEACPMDPNQHIGVPYQLHQKFIKYISEKIESSHLLQKSLNIEIDAPHTLYHIPYSFTIHYDVNCLTHL